eukprot:GHVU01060059.1.p1 GENE.GHVU01060059.1~~GHVU01060059.1.p1  ORF type:complete len:228 (-),score=16.79 GHVU01060059.1:593-1276(-)
MPSCVHPRMYSCVCVWGRGCVDVCVCASRSDRWHRTAPFLRVGARAGTYLIETRRSVVFPASIYVCVCVEYYYCRGAIPSLRDYLRYQCCSNSRPCLAAPVIHHYHHHHHPQTPHSSFISSSLTAITRSPTRLMILETEESAVRRGASNVAGELAGYGATCDVHHITAFASGGKGLARACAIALKESDTPKDDIGYINTHGTSTPYNDRAETQAYKSVFGDDERGDC